MLWFTSDWHLGHNREFIYKSRGFNNIQEHDAAVIENVRKYVKDDDVLYNLGDFCFSDYRPSFELVKGLLFKKILIIGNHDPSNKLNKMISNKVFDEIKWGDGITHNKLVYQMTHIPLALEKQNLLRYRPIINICGHTHSTEKFDEYGHINVCLDAWGMRPVSFDEIVEITEQNFKNKREELINELHQISSCS